MRKLFCLGLAPLLCALGTTTAARAGEPKPAPPKLPDKVTFSEHIAPIIFGNCTACHRPREAAPFKLMTYRDVQKRGRTILKVVERRYMPPWQPEPGHGEFLDERRLSDPQIALLRRWVQSGMAEGDPKLLPKPPKFQEGWFLGKPDLIVTMDRAFDVPANGPDVYRNFVLRLNLPEDKWVTAIELRPSARAVVHHALYFGDSNREARKLDGKDGKPGFAGMAFRGSGLIGGWAVGATPRRLPRGLAAAQRLRPRCPDPLSAFRQGGKGTADRRAVLRRQGAGAYPDRRLLAAGFWAVRRHRHSAGQSGLHRHRFVHAPGGR
jgi:hypothetical protein